MRHAYMAYRFFLVMAGGIVLAVTTSNPLFGPIAIVSRVRRNWPHGEPVSGTAR